MHRGLVETTVVRDDTDQRGSQRARPRRRFHTPYRQGGNELPPPPPHPTPYTPRFPPLGAGVSLERPYFVRLD